MRVLMLSLDRDILESGSLVQKRLLALAGTLGRDNTPPEPFKEGLGAPLGRGDTTPAPHFSEKVEGIPFDKGELTVLVPGERDEELKVSEHLTVYLVGGIKLVQFLKMWRVIQSLIFNPSSLTLNEKDHPTSILPSKEGRRQYDLITVQDTSYLALLAYLLAKKFQIPLEIQVHGLERFTGIRKRLAAFLFPRADKVRVVSKRLKEQLAKSYTLKANSLYVLPVYTQIEVPKQPSRQKTLPYPFTFLTVGRMVPVKNIALQIRALKRLAQEVPHVQLVIVGEGPEHGKLQFLISNFQLKDKVILAGRQDDLARFYQEADAFLLTSDSEGYGVAVTEAAAYKLPIIMTNVGLAGEFIRHNENGIVISVGDETQLLGAMREVLQSPELRARLGEAAFRAFRTLPTPEEQIAQQIAQWRSFR